MKKFSQIVKENLVYDNEGNTVVAEKPDLSELILMATGATKEYMDSYGVTAVDPVTQGLEPTTKELPKPPMDHGPEVPYDIPGWVHEIYQNCHKYTMMQAVEAMELLNDYYDLELDDDWDDEYDDEEQFPDDWEDDVEMEGDYAEALDPEQLDERTILTTQMRRKRAWKKKKKKILGKRANTKTFKRTHRFDHKKKKFVKRKKALKASDLKKKARIFRRVTRKGSTKAAAKRSRRRFGGKALPRV